jgi:5-methylcytosine-specific restriction enzyme A
MPRAVPEWIGKTPDSKVPDRVRVRVFEFFDGICQLCTAPILQARDYEVDHRKALIAGGEHRETNLQPVHFWCHAAKTRQDVCYKAKSYRIRRKRIVGQKPRSITMWRKFDGTIVRKPRARTPRRRP